MNQKAYLNHLISNRKYLENFERTNFNITHQEIKIPFISNIYTIANKKLRAKDEDSQQSCIQKQKTKNQYIINHLSAKQMARNKKTRRTSLLGSQNESKSSQDNQEDPELLKTKSMPMKNNDHLNRYIKDRRIKQNQKLPKINLEQLSAQRSQIPRKKRSQQISQKSYCQKLRTSMLKKCYQVDQNSISSRQASRSPSMRRLKTCKQQQNQHILQRILTVKPTIQLRRDSLIQKFELHKHYQRIRERKNINWCDSVSIRLRRSKTTSNNAKEYIKI